MPIDINTIVIFNVIVIAIYMPMMMLGNKLERNIKDKEKVGDEVRSTERSTLRVVTFIAMLATIVGMSGNIFFSYGFFKHQEIIAGIITVLLAMNNFVGDFPFKKEEIEKRMEERWV